MPLVRFQVRNEYGLGDPELYRGAAQREEPKALLDGVAVAGLVGILRQLGDLAELAAEIFHDLHEEVTAISARRHRMMARICHIEEALPSIEKAIQGQKSHIHFAYIAGSDWHSSIRIEHDHLRHTDLPRFIMDSYEECRDPPRLFLLDKFDSAGPGSGACLRRYSDPTYFKRVCASLEPVKAEKVQKVRKNRKSKKKLLRLKDGYVQHVMSLHHRTSSMQCTSPGTDGQSIAAETLSTSDLRLKSEHGSRSTSFDSGTRFSFVEPILDINSSIDTEDQDDNISSASMLKGSHIDVCATATAENKNVENADADDGFYNDYLGKQGDLGPPSVAWDEKTEIVKPVPKSKLLIDPVLDVNHSLESEEPECTELSSPKLRDSRTDAGGSSKPKESNVEDQDEVDDDDASHQDSPLEQNTPSSSSISWDEKAEIIRPTSPHLSDSDLVATIQDSDSHSLISESKQDAVTTTPGEIDKQEVLFRFTNIPAQFPGSNHFDEVISEAENYVDALNTLDSETDTDSEFQTKRELMSPHDSSYQGMVCRTGNMQDMAVPSSGSSDVESSITSHISLNEDASSVSPNLVPSGSAASAKSSNGPSGCSIDDGHEKCNVDTSRMNTFEVANFDPSLRSTIPNSEELLNTGISTMERQELQVPKVCDGPIKFWTNGGLLGLEPSKPPDFNVTNFEHENSVPYTHFKNGCDVLKDGATPRFHCNASSSKSETAVLSYESKYRSGVKEGTLDLTTSHCATLHSEVVAGGSSNLVYPAEPSTSFHCNEQHEVRPISKPQEFVPALSKPELDKFQEPQPSNILANGNGHDLAKAEVASHGDESSVSLNCQVSSGQHGPLKGVSSSLTSLTRKLLTNGLQRKESLSHSNLPVPCVLDTNSTKLHNTSIPSDETQKLNGASSQESFVPKPPEKAEFSSAGNTLFSMLHCSPQSSPPLEHMRISFHPMNGLETSKLKLEFPDGHLHESIEELMFPSFQLLPCPTIPLQSMCSESDDDTFCRSCSYSSEGVCSPHSDSNSELWAQDEASGSEDHEINDDSRRFSSLTASVSGSLEPEGRKPIVINQASMHEKLDRENGIIAFQSGPFLDLPNLDSLKSSVTEQGGKCASVSNEAPHCILSSSSSQPPLPPLPPLQWRILRPSVSVDDNKHSNNEINHSDDPQFIRFMTVQPERQVPRPPCNGENRCPDKSTLNGHKDLNKDSKGGEPDEREDLLHQIRNKSFSLRPTVPSRPSLVPRSTTNANVAAILEKANAIRQAFVGSDEGGDDENWSDG
uniref:Protein SCAR n=1 Tax=Anthurium amnicola TaxID=1678845 RepID=A0A1D1YB97_9ARAE